MNLGNGDQPVLNVRGQKIGLGPIRRDLLPSYQRWMNDFEVARGLSSSVRPASMEAEEEWFSAAAKSDREIHFTVYELATMRPIGNTGLHKVDRANRSAEFGILIGERECWGKGYGTETASLVLDYAFNVLGLHNVMLHVFSFNERAIRAYLRAGFKEAGRLREAQRYGNRVYDIVIMDCLSTEFESPVLAELLP